MTTIEKQLRQKYDGKKIDDIETEIKDNKTLSIEARKVAIFALSYLRITGRHKENPTYRKSNFFNYLFDYYNIREHTFREAEKAFLNYPEESVKYGVGLIAKIGRMCSDSVQTRKAIKDIVNADKELKTPIKREKIDSILNKYARPKKDKPQQQVLDYKRLYFKERDDHAATRAELKKAMEQIQKLKKTVSRLKLLGSTESAAKPFMLPENDSHKAAGAGAV